MRRAGQPGRPDIIPPDKTTRTNTQDGNDQRRGSTGRSGGRDRIAGDLGHRLVLSRGGRARARRRGRTRLPPVERGTRPVSAEHRHHRRLCARLPRPVLRPHARRHRRRTAPPRPPHGRGQRHRRRGRPPAGAEQCRVPRRPRVRRHHHRQQRAARRRLPRDPPAHQARGDHQPRGQGHEDPELHGEPPAGRRAGRPGTARARPQAPCGHLRPRARAGQPPAPGRVPRDRARRGHRLRHHPCGARRLHGAGRLGRHRGAAGAQDEVHGPLLRERPDGHGRHLEARRGGQVGAGRRVRRRLRQHRHGRLPAAPPDHGGHAHRRDGPQRLPAAREPVLRQGTVHRARLSPTFVPRDSLRKIGR